MFLKILQLVPEALPTFRPDVAVLFGKYLPRHQVVCDLVGTADSAPFQEQNFASAQRPLYYSSRLRREWSFIKLSLRSLLSARRGDCHIIQVRDMVSIGLLAMCIARFKKIPFTYWVSYLMCEGRIENARHQLARQPSLRQRLVLVKGLLEAQLLYRLVLPGAKHIFVQSDAMRDYMIAKGIPAERLSAVPMGVDMELMEGAARSSRRPEGWQDVPLLAYLGTLDKSRNVERLIEALQLLRVTVPRACLLLIGGSPYVQDEQDLLQYAERAGLSDAVRITGWLPSAQAWELLLGADLALSYIPRGVRYDVSSPTKLLEYLALAMPAVGNDSPDQVQVLEASQAGWLTVSMPAAMASAMDEVLANPERARLRASHGPAYIASARSYAIIAAQVAQQYRHIAAA